MKWASEMRDQRQKYTMNQQEISQILLIRSVEESDPYFFSSEILRDASHVSSETDTDAAIIQKRAGYLFEKLPAHLRTIPRSLHISRKWIAVSCIMIFFLGILINYLGPGEKIHVLYNPVVLLVLWTCIVFSLFVAKNVFYRRKDRRVRSLRSDQTPVRNGWMSDVQKASFPPLKKNIFSSRSFTGGSFLLRKVVVRWIKKQWSAAYYKLHEKKEGGVKPPSLMKIISLYGDHWWEHYQHIVLARLALVVHALAIALVLGALAGVYVRGLFFEYNVVWKSTFIRDPSLVSFVLNIFFGVPSLVLNGTLIEQSVVSHLLVPEGAPAASWIHIFAVSCLLFVIPARLILMIFASKAVRDLSGLVSIDLSEQYYVKCVKNIRETQASRMRDAISGLLRIEISKMSVAIADFTRNEFYDHHVVPQLTAFRDNGGRIQDLESAIEHESKIFASRLDPFLENARADFERSLTQGVMKIMGKELTPIDVTIGKGVHVVPRNSGRHFGGAVTRDMTNAIGVAVTAAIATTLGTISGGFGKFLGVAIISTLLHTTGPVGFLIGALAGLLLGGSASLIAKEKIQDMVTDKKFPSFLTQLLMRDAKLKKTIEQGRNDVYNSVKAQIEQTLSPLADEIINRIVSRIEPVIQKQDFS